MKSTAYRLTIVTKTYGKIKIKLPAFLTSELHEGEWSPPHTYAGSGRSDETKNYSFSYEYKGNDTWSSCMSTARHYQPACAVRRSNAGSPQEGKRVELDPAAEVECVPLP